MTVNPVGSYPLAGVDFSIAGQSGTIYKTNLDNAILAGKRIHNAFAPHELNQPLVAYDNTDVTPGTDIITVVGHTLVNGMAVKNVNDQEPSDPPAPLVDAVTYYVVGVAGNDFQLAATVGGAAIDLTDAGTGANVLTPQPAMFVQLDAGFVWDGSTLTEKALQTTAIIVKPSANPRIDRITVNPTTGVFTLTAGVEAGSPVPPAIPAGNFPNCQIALTTATTAISNVEITDERALWISDAIPSIEKGAASGVATLDGSGNVVEPVLHILTNSVDDSIQTDTGIIKSLTIPANTLLADGQMLRLMMAGTKSGTVESKTVQIRFGTSPTLLDNISLATAALGWSVELVIIRKSATTARGYIRTYKNTSSVYTLNAASGLALSGLNFATSQTFDANVSVSSGTSNVTHVVSSIEVAK